MEGLDMMDWMLAEAKRKPMTISHDFDTRFRVWVDQIIPNRWNAIRQCKGDVDYVLRMINLTGGDASRLQDRLIQEWGDDSDFPLYSARLSCVFNTFLQAVHAYLNEVKQ